MEAMREGLSLNATVARRDDVMAAEVGREVVMLRLESNAYYSLDETGAEIWRLLERPRRVEDLCADLEQQFDVTSDVCRADVLAFLREALGQGIIRIVGG